MPAAVNAVAQLSTVALLDVSENAGTTRTGSGVDISSYEGIGRVTHQGLDTAGTLDGKIQHSPDNSTWADLTGATFAQVTGGGAFLESIDIDLSQADRYIRYVGTLATTPDMSFGVTLAALKKYKP